MSEKMPFKLRLQRVIFYSVALLVVTAAVLLSIARMLVSDVESYRLDLEQLASAFLDHPVKIDGMDARFVGLSPTLVFENVRMLDARGERVLISFKEARLSVAVLASLQAEKLVPGDLVIDGVNFNVIRQQDGQIRIQGINFEKFSSDEIGDASQSSGQLSQWLFQRSRLAIRNSTLVWNDFKRGISRRFDDVNLQLSNDESDHFMKGEITLPQAFGRKLELAVAVHGNMLQPAHWQGEVYVNAEGLNLYAWQDALQVHDVNVRAGLLDLKMWAALNKGRLTNLSGDVSVYKLAMQAGFLAQPLGFDRAGGLFNYQASKQGWALDIDELQFIEGENIWPASRLHAGLRYGEEDRPDQLELAADYLPLDKITSLLLKTHLLPDKDRMRLQQARPVGDIHNLVVTTLLTEDLLSGPYRIQARFSDLGLQAVGAEPGFQGLSGTLWANEERGKVQLSSGASALDFKTIFRAPLELRQLTGEVFWKKQHGSWQVWSEALAADTPYINTNNRFLLEVTGTDVAPYLDLQTTFHDGNGAFASLYVPAGIMNTDLIKWLDTAIKGGHVIEGGAIFNGRLSDFPFNKNQGQFMVYFAGEDIRLDYAPGWPAATAVHGEATFSGIGVTVQVDSGKLLNSQISRARLDIPSFNDGLLTLDGTVKGSLRDAADFLVKSPIAPEAKTFVSSSRIEGQAQTTLQLRFPLSDEAAARAPEQYSGKTQIIDGALLLYDDRVDITALNGDIEFSQSGQSGSGITGLVMGQKAVFDLYTQPGEAGNQTSIVANTNLDAGELKRRFKLAQNRLSGKSALQAVLLLGKDAKGKARPPMLRLHSNLHGMTLELPAPMAKPPAVKSDLDVEVGFAGIDEATIQINYADQFRTAFAMHMNSVDRIAVQFGPKPPVLPARSGVRITGSARNLSVTAWRSLIEELLPASGQTQKILPISIDMQLLEIGKLAETESDYASSIDVKRIPPVRGTIKQLVYDNLPIGSVTFSTTRIRHGIRIDWMDVNGPHFQLHATGEWKKSILGETTSLDITSSSQNAGNALKDLGYAVIIKEGVMQGSAKISWPGSPMQFDAAKLKGSMHLNIQKGSFTDVDAGAGRLLGLFSLTALPRRLILDFRDTFKEGFSFDELNGDFRLAGGNSTTDNLTIKSPSAVVAITGRVGLVQKDFDEVMTVVPQFGGSLPVAGGLVFGLEVGAAILLLDQLLGKEINKAGTKQYTITGSWENPQITEIKKPPSPELPDEED
ncbi:MAG: hypothetical protein LJE74_09850 [Proteobacteria bacterium]|jgi:uncharacterized protein (TIGR02099 family)|nr:hypothetical protein [Pseudomonadota bacterium]